MPIILLLERLPLPNLRTYTSFSVLLLVCVLGVSHFSVFDYFENFNSITVFRPWDLKHSSNLEHLDSFDPKLNLDVDRTKSEQIDTASKQNEKSLLGNIKLQYARLKWETTETGKLSKVSDSEKVKEAMAEKESIAKKEVFDIRQHYDVYLHSLVNVLLAETWCVWTLINMVCCCLILIGKTIQNMVFGELRVSEREHLREKFWNFVFYKFIFIFGVMNVHSLDDLLMWCAWFSLLGFLHLLAQICKDRFEYLSFSPMTSRWIHLRILALLSTVLVISNSLIVVSVFVGLQTGFHTFAFLAAECVLLILSTTFVIIRYAIHLWELNHDGVWEKKSTYLYYTELIFDLLSFFVDFTHHLHMLIWGNIFLSMANLIICMQLRYLFHAFQRRVQRHKNYMRVVKNMELLYPTVIGKPGENDQCAICWDSLEVARKLPCGHLFHNACLSSWLEQDSTCPTCRTTLRDPQQTIQLNPEVNLGGGGDADQTLALGAHARTINHYFQFNGSRYVSWLPSFSVEVTHTRLAPVQAGMPSDASHLNQMARQVQNVFPNIPLTTLLEDLHITYNVDQTIENILEGRLIVPPPRRTQVDASDLYGNLHVVGQSMALSQYTEHSTQAPSTSSTIPRGDMDFVYSSSYTTDHDSYASDHSLLPSMMNFTPCQFSKNPIERQQMLAQRKKDLLHTAKRRYLARQRQKSHVHLFDCDEATTHNDGLNSVGYSDEGDVAGNGT